MLDNCVSLSKKAVELLLEKNMCISFAESCTAGYLSKLITDISGASAVFECGIVAYSNRMKKQLLGVSERTLNSFGAVSEQVAKEMAQGVFSLSGANIGIGVTGIAGPMSDETGKPVGLSFIALADAEQTQAVCVQTNNLSREENRIYTAEKALELLIKHLEP